jgi:ElaB/YqjD/DUF883 family membrane-anchored ribosome-binding protein
MATMDSVGNTASDAKEQIAQLRRQVEQLMSERVTPVLADAAGRAESAARQATDIAREQAEAVSSRVREQPLLAILIAAGAGYLVGRLFR